MSQLVSRKIPTTMNPWICSINNVPYAYPAGTVQMVPEEVAQIIDSYNDYNKPPEAPEPGSQMGGADWNAKEGEPGHVKNRTHWVEQGEKTVLEESMEFTGTDTSITEISPAIEHGKTYVVEYDGKTYPCVGGNRVTNVNGINASAIWLGNASLESDILNAFGADVSDTGEPFLYIKCTQDSAVVVNKFKINNATVYNYTTVPLKIVLTDETVHKLPGKYLPEGVPHIEGDGEATDTLTFDGNVEGKDAIHAGEGMYMVRMSPEYVDSSALIGGTFTTVGLVPDFPSGSQPITEVFDMSESYGFPAYAIGDVVMVLSQDYTMEGTTMPKGISFPCRSGFGYVSELKAPSAVFSGVKTYHKLDNRLLDLEWLPIVKKKTIVPETTFENSMPESVGGYSVIPFGTIFVTVDGKTYETTHRYVEAGAESFSMFGNVSSIDQSAPNTGEPFYGTCYADITTFTFADGAAHTASIATPEPDKMPEGFLPESVDSVVIRSSTEGSTKKFRLTVDDSGTISATEIA